MSIVLAAITGLGGEGGGEIKMSARWHFMSWILDLW